jgi:aminoacrylate peracid reductase
MPKTVIVPKNAAPPLAPYSPGTRADGTVYVSGTLALDAQGKAIGAGDVRAQTRAVLESVKAVIEAAGGTLKDVTFNMIFLKDYADYAAMNEVYREYFAAEPPARYCIKAELVRPEFLVEIASIAHVGKVAS